MSDFFDFSIYVDAGENDIEQWYIERFLTLRETVFQNTSSYFHRYARLTRREAIETARRLWRSINLVNLRENVLPTRERAHLILEKGRDHAVAARTAPEAVIRTRRASSAADRLAGEQRRDVAGRERPREEIALRMRTVERAQLLGVRDRSRRLRR